MIIIKIIKFWVFMKNKDIRDNIEILKDILTLLKNENLSASEISEELDLERETVEDFLKTMVEANLVEYSDD